MLVVLLLLLLFLVKKYAHGYLPSLPIFYVFAKRGKYIKDTFGRARHRKLARQAGRTLCTPEFPWCHARMVDAVTGITLFDLQQLY
jgi:hypothetical protein